MDGTDQSQRGENRVSEKPPDRVQFMLLSPCVCFLVQAPGEV